MANNIELSKEYLDLLDEVYQKESVTSDLNGAPEDIKEGLNAGEYLVAKYSMDGLKDYKRNDGYKNGNVSLTWETLRADYDRGTKFVIDVLDNKQAKEIPFGKLAAEFIRTRVVPEGDAFVFAKLASYSDITKMTPKTFTTGKELLKEVIDADAKMTEDEVPETGRILYITPTLYNSLYKEDNLTNYGILDNFEKVIKVPQKRFYTAIDLLSGNTGEEAGHYKKAAAGKDINFMIVEKSSVVKHDVHVASDIIPSELNPNSDGDIQKYRKHALCQAYENKRAGIVISYKA